QAEDGIRDFHVTGVQTCALPISIVGSSLRFRFKGGNSCGVMSRLGMGKSSCFRMVGFKNGISDIMAPPDSHWIQTTYRAWSPTFHNWHDDCDHNFVHLDATVSMALASALLPEWFVCHLTQINGGYAAYDNDP